LDNERETKD